MTTKKARSMAGLPWIAAMAFFMQALDATILNTALPAIAQSLNRSPLAMQSAIISYNPDGRNVNSGQRLAGRPLWHPQSFHAGRHALLRSVHWPVRSPHP